MKQSVLKLLVLVMLVSGYTSISALKNFVLISLPGSGKGTFSQYIGQKYDYEQICPGDILRAEVAAGTELGKKMAPVLEKADKLDEDIVWALVNHKLEQTLAAKKPFIIDGFPKSEKSFERLENFFNEHKIDRKNICFLQFIASDEVCLVRMGSRIICTGKDCAKVYNATALPPKKLNICDQCGASLTGRAADNAAIAQKRFANFHKNIEPLLHLAQQRGFEVKKINADLPLQELYKQYDELVATNAQETQS